MSLKIALFLSLGFGQSLAFSTSTDVPFSSSTGVPFSSTSFGFDLIQIENVRFFLDLYNNDVINAYPLDVCVSNGEGDDSQNVIYTCINNYAVVRTSYEDDSCTSEIDSAVTFTFANVSDDTGLYFFNCDGIDSYVGVEFCVNMEKDECNDCLASGTRYTVVNFCFNANNEQNTSDSETYDAVTDGTGDYVCTLCDNNSTNYLSIPIGESFNLFDIQALTSYPYCSLYDNVTVLGETVNVNSQMKECVINGEIQYVEPTSQPTVSPNDIETTMNIMDTSHTTRESDDDSTTTTSPVNPDDDSTTSASPVNPDDDSTTTASPVNPDVVTSTTSLPDDSNDNNAVITTTKVDIIVDATDSFDESKGVINNLSKFILLISICGFINA